MTDVPYVECLESAGLVAVRREPEEEGDLLLWPDDADELADALRAAAKRVRDA